MEYTRQMALKASAAYLLLGVLWVLFSDAILSSLIGDVRLYAQMQILKGWLFMLVSSSALYFLLKKWTALFLGDSVRQKGAAKKRLAESEERFRSVVECAPTAMVMVNHTGEINLVNSQAEDLFGYSRDELLGRSIETLLPEGLREKNGSRRNGFLSRPDSWKARDVFGLRKDGLEIPLEIGLTSLQTGEGKMVLSSIIDITDWKEAEKALRDSEQCYRLLFEANPHPMWFFDVVTSRFLDVNASAIVHYGYSRQEFLSMTLADILSPDQKESHGEDPVHHHDGSDFAALSNHRKKDGTIIQVKETSQEISFSGRKAKVVLANDITKRLWAEEQTRFRSRLLNEVGEAVMATDLEGTITYWNKSAEELYGWSAMNAIGKSIHEVAPSDSSREQTARILECLSRGRSWSGEFPVHRKDGTVFPAAVTDSPLLDAQGELIGIIGISSDITERTRVEAKLRLSQERFEIVARATNDVIWDWDLVRNTIWWDASFLTRFGYRPEDIEPGPESWTGRLHPDDRERVMHKIRAVIDGTGEFWSDEYRFRHEDGSYVDIFDRGFVLRNPGARALRMTGAMQDITERRRMDEAMRESEARFRQLTDAIKEVFWLTNPATNEMLYISPGYEEIWGRTCESALKDPSSWSEAIHADDRNRVLHSALSQRSAGTYDESFRVVRPDGTVRWVHDQAFPIRNHNGDVVRIAGITEDVTERKSLEEQLRQAQKLESLGTLAGGIAHDFNNILGIIMGHTALLERGNQDQARRTRSTEVIGQSALRGAELVRQLMTFARKSDVTFESVMVNDIVNEIARLLKETLPKVITISTSLHTNMPSIVADPTQVHQVLLNLCINARDALLPAGGGLSIATELASGDIVRKRFLDAGALQYVLLTVADTGAGMDEATQLRMFEPFFTTKAKGKGTGLGLATVYGILNSHKGFIDVVSEAGKGSKFFVYFPVPLSQSPALHTDADVSGVVRGGTETILVVEDEEMLRALMITMLESHGYQVLIATDGDQGIGVYSQAYQKIALVITDLGLPKIGGEALMVVLKEINPAVKIIVASGYMDSEQKSRLFRAGAKEIVLKPFKPVDFLSRVREVLDL